MARIAFVIAAIWLIFSVWVESGVFQYGVWAGLLAAAQVMCLSILAISNLPIDKH